MTACMLGKCKERGVGSQRSNDNAPDIPHLGRQALSHHHFISDAALRDFAIDKSTYPTWPARPSARRVEGQSDERRHCSKGSCLDDVLVSRVVEVQAGQIPKLQCITRVQSGRVGIFLAGNVLRYVFAAF